MLNRGKLGTLVVTAALAAAGLITAGGAAGSPAQALAPPMAGSPTVPTPDVSPLPPGAPGGLTATRVTATSVTLTWTASARGCCDIAGYDISYSQAFNDVFWLEPAGDVTGVTVTSNIRPGTQYTFRVSARDVAGHRSTSSNAVTVVTPIADTGPDQVPPAAPTGLTAGSITAAGVPLSWSPSTDNVAVTGYDVYWFDGWFSSTRLATVTGTSYTAPLPSSSSSRNFWYVRARDAAGNVSIATGTVTAGPITTTPPTTPPVPPSCRVTYTTTGQWAHGFTANLTVTNIGGTPIDAWTLAYAFGGDQRIVASWNSTFRQTGTAVTMSNAHWNGTLAPGRSTTFGIRGTWTADATAPAAFTLNDRPCTTG